MDRRITRSAARLAAEVRAPPLVGSSEKKRRESSGTAPAPATTTPAPTPTAKKRRLKKEILEELPHNLGAPLIGTQPPLPTPRPTPKQTPKIKPENDDLATSLQGTVNKTATKTTAPNKTKKAKKASSYGLTPGISPFADWVHPTPAECEEVNTLLSSIHGEITPPKTIPEPSLTVTGCGEVPSVLDALIRTLLSGATSGNNSALAFNGLVQRFGILQDGIGKGSVNWDAVRRASLKEVFDAIKRGGLADVKSKNIKAILDMVYQENQERRDAIVEGKIKDEDDADVGESSGREKYDVACAEQHFLSLNHLHSMETQPAMLELMKYPGIGPKTAACVLLFCLQRPCFAVDTHIFRICKWLNWVPSDRATEITTFSHLEVRIPDHLKYSLHQLLIRHGKSCPRCRAITGQSAAGWEDGCVIDHLVTRTGRRKGNVV